MIRTHGQFTKTIPFTKGTDMNFFTPEWLNDRIVAQMHEPMRKTQNASVFSERFFEKLYKVEKKAFIRYYKRAARLQRIPFDTAATEKQFDLNYEENLAFVKANLPADILSDVKDVRVLALGSVEYDVAARIERFCGQLKRKCRDVEEQYEEQLESVAEKTGWDTVHALDNLIDAQIESVDAAAGDVVISLYAEDTRASLTVILRGADLPQSSQNAVGGIVCRPELVESEGNLAFGLLCVNNDSVPFTLEVTAQSVEIKSN